MRILTAITPVLPVVLFLCAAPQVQALTVSVTKVYAKSTFDPADLPRLNKDDPLTVGPFESKTSKTTLRRGSYDNCMDDYFCGFSETVQKSNGASSVDSEGVFVGSPSKKPLKPSVVRSQAKISYEVWNDGDVAVPVTVTVSLKNISLYINGDGGGADQLSKIEDYDEQRHVNVGLQFLLQGGNTLTNISEHFFIAGGDEQYASNFTENFKGTETKRICNNIACGVHVSIPDVKFTDILLGWIDPGEAQIFEGIMTSYVIGMPYENFGYARMGDPNSIMVEFSGANVAAVPLPAAGLLLLTALGGMGLAGRRRRRAA